MSEYLTPEERALLAADEDKATPRKRKMTVVEPRESKDDSVDTAATAPAPARGPHTPVQYDDDGWNGLPVQMRG